MSASAMKYVGDGSFLIGVPARDLSAAEAEQYADLVTGSPLYVPVVAQSAPEPAMAEATGEVAPVEGAGKRRKGE